MGYDHRRSRGVLGRGAWCFAALLLAGPGFAGVNKWTAIGPDGTYVAALAVEPRNASIAYAGTWHFGVLRTNDGGANWTTANGGISTSTINTLAIDPSLPSTVYAGGIGGVFKSVDGGQKWFSASLGLGTSRSVWVGTLAIDPKSPETLYALTDPGIYKSMNGGGTWTAVMIGEPSLTATAFAIDPTVPSTLYASTWETNADGFAAIGVIKSIDGGAHWTRIYWVPPSRERQPSGIVALSVDPRSPSRLLALLESRQATLSNDGGATWSNFGPAGILAQSVAFDPVEPSTIYIGAKSGMVYRTADAGAHWTSSADQSRTGGVTALALSPSAPTSLYAGGANGISRSLDRGQTWSRQTLGVKDVQVQYITVDPTAPSTIYVVSYGDVAKTIDGGAQWTGWGLGLSGGELGFVAIDPSTRSTLYIGSQRSSYDGSRFYKTTDGGEHWDASISSPNGVGAFAIAPSRPTTFYASTGAFVLAKSTNGGASWIDIGFGLPVEFVWALKVHPMLEDTVYVAADCGFVPCLYKSTDGGAHWRELRVGSSASWDSLMLAMDPVSPSTLYLGTSVPELFKTIDGGETWKALPTRAGSIVALAFDPKQSSRIYAATGTGVWTSGDGGETWASISSGLPGSGGVVDIWIDPTGTLLRAAGNAGVFEYQIAEATAPVSKIGAGFTGSWFNPAQNGHGFMLEVLPGVPMQLLASWFAFAPEGGPLWITGLGPINGGEVTVQAYRTVGGGGRFPPNFDAANVHQEAWGTLTFTFNDCDHGHVDWMPSVPGFGRGGMDLARLTLPAGLSCTATSASGAH